MYMYICLFPLLQVGGWVKVSIRNAMINNSQPSIVYAYTLSPFIPRGGGEECCESSSYGSVVLVTPRAIHGDGARVHQPTSLSQVVGM